MDAEVSTTMPTAAVAGVPVWESAGGGRPVEGVEQARYGMGGLDGHGSGVVYSVDAEGLCDGSGGELSVCGADGAGWGCSPGDGAGSGVGGMTGGCDCHDGSGYGRPYRRLDVVRRL